MHLCACLRALDVAAINDAIGLGARKSTARDEQLEGLVRWRTRIVNEADEAIQAFIDEYPAADRQRIRNLAAAVRKDPKSRAKKTLMTALKEAAEI